MKKIVFSILISLVIVSCKSQSLLQYDQIENIKSVMQAFGKSNEKKISIYKKSFESDYYNSSFISTIGNGLIVNTNRDDLKKVREIKDSLSLSEKYSSFEVDSLTNIATKSLLNISIGDILDNKDLEKMKKTYSDKSISWPKKIFEKINVTNNKNDFIVSVPVFSIDNSLAMLYVQHNNSLSLEFYEKKDGNTWIRIGVSLLRRAD